MSYDFQTYKQKILIRDAALMAGYSIVPGKDGSGSVVMQCGGDKIVVMRPRDITTNRFFNPGNDRDKGDLINFIQNRLDYFSASVKWNESQLYRGTFNATAIIAILQWMDGTYQSPEMQAQLSSISNRQQISFSLSNYDIQPLNSNGLNYLTNKRQLSLRTIQRFQPFMCMCRNLLNHKFFVYNLAFPYKVPGIDQICNFELRNYTYKGHAEGGNKSTACWIADFSPSHLLTREIFIFESTIDAMSYAELHEHDIQFDMVAFVSLGGSISIGQILTLRDYFPSARFHLCFDNDLQGHMYDIKVSCILENRTLQKTETDDSIRYNLDGKIFEILKNELTYTRFKQESKCVRISLFIHKPKALVDVIDPKSNKKTTVTFKDYNECLTYKKLRYRKKPERFSRTQNT